MAIRRTLAEFSDDIASADIADNAVTTAKILDANVTTAKIADNQITLAKMAGGTDGQIITYDASGDPVAVGPGTDGQVLTSTGAGSPPAYEALPASDNASALTSGTLATARMAAGTVVQVTNTVYHSGNSDATTSSTFGRVGISSNYHWTGQITNVGASNYVFITMTFAWKGNKNSYHEVGLGFGFFRETTAITTPTDYQILFENGAGTSNRTYYGELTLTWMDKSPATGTNNYYLGYKARGSGEAKVMSASDALPFGCTLMEIQQ